MFDLYSGNLAMLTFQWVKWTAFAMLVTSRKAGIAECGQSDQLDKAAMFRIFHLVRSSHVYCAQH